MNRNGAKNTDLTLKIHPQTVKYKLSSLARTKVRVYGHVGGNTAEEAARSDEPMQLFQNLGKFFVGKTVHHVGKPGSETDYIFPDVLLLNNDIANQ